MGVLGAEPLPHLDWTPPLTFSGTTRLGRIPGCLPRNSVQSTAVRLRQRAYAATRQPVSGVNKEQQRTITNTLTVEKFP